MAKKIFFGNYKGGVAKTTSAFQIGGWMASQNKRVLMVDLDPQSSLSTICANCNNIRLEDYSYSYTLNYAIELYSRYISSELNDYKLFSNQIENLSTHVSKIIQPIKLTRVVHKNFCFIPSSISFNNSRLNDLAQRLSQNIFNIVTIKLILEQLECDNNYDFIIFDCPPTSNILTQSVFLLSDYYCIPTICDEISMDGVPDYISEIESIYSKYCMNDQLGGIFINMMFGNRPKLIGVFETMYKNRRNSKLATELFRIENLDKNIRKLNIRSLLLEDSFKNYRYNKPADTIDTLHTFKEYIRHVDGRTTGTSMPMHMKNGLLHDDYRKISFQLLNMLK